MGIHIVYGRHESSMEFSASVSFPPNNCIKLGDRTFTVLPPASPHFSSPTSEMSGNGFEIPSGWKVAEEADDFEDIRVNIIQPYYWGTNVILVKKGDRWNAYKSAAFNPPGAFHEDCKWFSLQSD